MNGVQAVPISRQMLPTEGRLQAQHKQYGTVNLQYMYTVKARWYTTVQYQRMSEQILASNRGQDMQNSV